MKNDIENKVEKLLEVIEDINMHDKDKFMLINEIKDIKDRIKLT